MKLLPVVLPKLSTPQNTRTVKKFVGLSMHLEITKFQEKLEFIDLPQIDLSKRCSNTENRVSCVKIGFKNSLRSIARLFGSNPREKIERVACEGEENV
jgi:hypothetical protein